MRKKVYFEKILHSLRVKFNTDSEYDASFGHTGFRSPLRTGDFQTCGNVYFLKTFALLLKRCNYVTMIATEIFMRTNFVENFMPNIFCDMTFSSKVHISRENREKLILSSHFGAKRRSVDSFW